MAITKSVIFTGLSALTFAVTLTEESFINGPAQSLAEGRKSLAQSTIPPIPLSSNSPYLFYTANASFGNAPQTSKGIIYDST